MRGAGKFFIIIYCYYKLSFETLRLLLISTHSARVNIVFRVGDDYEYTGAQAMATNGLRSAVTTDLARAGLPLHRLTIPIGVNE